MPHRSAQSLLLCDLFKPGDLASSLCVGEHSLTVLDEAGKPIPLYATPIDLSKPRRLTLIAHAPNVWNDLAHAGFGVVRLFNTKSEPVASIPFVHH